LTIALESEPREMCARPSPGSEFAE